MKFFNLAWFRFCKVWSATTFTTFWYQIKIWHCWRGSTVNFFTCCHLSALSKVICFSWELSDQGQEWQRVNKQWFLQRQSIKSFTQSFRSKMSLPQRWVCACVVLMVRYRCNFKISAFYLHNTLEMLQIWTIDSNMYSIDCYTTGLILVWIILQTFFKKLKHRL